MLNENFVSHMMSAISKGYTESHTKMFALASLWVSDHNRKYVVGDQVVIENGVLMNFKDEVPTHEITLLEGTLSDSKHSITLRNLSTNEILNIDLN